ncbi:MAG: beta-ketoacyl synthase N-terminal-like domain-containing protein [Candidatus Tectimicrobiota bacterium]
MRTDQALRAVITGVGCVAPFGVGQHDFVTAMLRANVTAIGPLTNFQTAGLSSHLGAEIPASYLPMTDEARRWSRLGHMTVLACRQAAADARVSAADGLRHAGLVVGSEFGDLRSTTAFSAGFLRKGPLGLSPLLFPNTVMNAMAGVTSLALGIRGPMLTLNQAGIAGELAVVRALALLQAGRAAMVIACGVDELFPLLYETLVELRVPSPRGGGDEACRPFDKRHNGPVLGEGATAVVLESLAHAQARGARILAEVRTIYWGGMAAPPGRYPVWCPAQHAQLVQALHRQGVCPAAVDLVYLAGCGDPQHDRLELAWMEATFGSAGPSYTSVTHLTGEYGGLGTLRVAAATASVQQGVVPVLDYLCQPVRDDMALVRQPVTRPPTVVLIHGVARGGAQVALLVTPLRDEDVLKD